jgi:hypothetical protein
MYTFQVSSQINENGLLSIKLPQEWANQQVNVLLVLEALQNSLKQPEPANLTRAFELLTQLPDDFMNERTSDAPQSREEWL